MTFDIHQFASDTDTDMDNLGANEYQEAISDYIDAAIHAFMNAPEGEAIREQEFAGAWAAQFLRYGMDYLGVSPPDMTTDNVREILSDLFPRKVSLENPAEATSIVPELLAFWQFLHREYQLPRAAEILDYLRELEPGFPAMMNDPSRFGMAKAIFMGGMAAGFDMTDPSQVSQYTLLHNMALADRQGALPHLPATRGAAKKGDSAQRKKQRKLAKAARKSNRKKR